MFIYLFAIFFPMSRSYRGYMAPVSWIFTYLWITAFVFSSQVWSGAACANEQPSTASCSKKKTVEAFTFIALYVSLSSMVELLTASMQLVPITRSDAGGCFVCSDSYERRTRRSVGGD